MARLTWHGGIRAATLIIFGVLTCVAVARPAPADAAADGHELVVRLDSGGGVVASGASDVYRVVVTNRGRQDLSDIRVTVNFDSWFRITQAEGSRTVRPTIAVWRTVLPKGKDTVFTARGVFARIPSTVKVTHATACAFAPDQVGPLVCNSDLDDVTTASPTNWTSGFSATWSILFLLGIVAFGVLLMLRHRRMRCRRKETADPWPTADDLAAATADEPARGEPPAV
jgi:hypothetical protein